MIPFLSTLTNWLKSKAADLFSNSDQQTDQAIDNSNSTSSKIYLFSISSVFMNVFSTCQSCKEKCSEEKKAKGNRSY